MIRNYIEYFPSRGLVPVPLRGFQRFSGLKETGRIYRDTRDAGDRERSRSSDWF
jgi:hypothetical protein